MVNILLDDRFFLRDIMVPGEFSVDALNKKDISLSRCPRGETIRIEFTEFAVRHAAGQISKTASAGQKIGTMRVKHLLALFEPEGRQVTAGKAADHDEEFEAVLWAATKQFYANRYIDHRAEVGYYSKGDPDLIGFIAANHAEASSRGFGKFTPSTSTIRKLVFGRTSHVSLADCFRKEGGVRDRGIWPRWVYDLATEALEKRFDGEFATSGQAYEWFFGEFHKERDEGVGIPPDKRQKPPDEKTFSNWLKNYSTKERLAKLHGEREAARRLQGTIVPQDARYPLHIVIIDQTLGNIWSAVKRQTAERDQAQAEEASDESEEEEILDTKRVEVVYAVDAFTRMSLGIILTFEPPSISTFMACLKMVMTPKTGWAKRFPDLPDATDGYGCPTTVVVDNLRAHVTRSIQLGLLSIGIGIEYAPLASPEWKAIVERAIGTCKRVMATLPGGFSIDEDVKSADYRKYARYDLEEINDLVIHKIVTEHHMLVHSGIDEPPAYRWSKHLPVHGRGIVADMRVLDLLLRRRGEAKLTPNGVIFKGHRYQNTAYATRILNSRASELASKTGKRSTLKVDVLWNPRDVSSLGVIDSKSNDVLFFANVDPVFMNAAVSFTFAKEARQANNKIFDEYYPAATRAKYLREFFEMLQARIKKEKHRDAKKTARLLEGGRAVVISADVQQFDVVIPVTNLGVSQVDVPVQLRLEHIQGPTETPKQTGVNRPMKKTERPVPPPEPVSGDQGNAPALYAMSAEESEAFLDQLERSGRRSLRH
ncbi:DDE-type integrase/transposase/recombinase [Rhizobium leguminosarum]|uniref:DDE-type integrase/transposase/recombinase n=1 Tax=Rhizobium leguminosarum TaxID=384 RepID=UPI0013DCC8A0|nr:DDE-type integrase/transposase/recombinase [Rhizobium leguminosarum]NEH47438.1 DDE-type integrase/transposase/recombinase [Rhizobium leguminosarum]